MRAVRRTPTTTSGNTCALASYRAGAITESITRQKKQIGFLPVPWAVRGGRGMFGFVEWSLLGEKEPPRPFSSADFYGGERRGSGSYYPSSVSSLFFCPPLQHSFFLSFLLSPHVAYPGGPLPRIVVRSPRADKDSISQLVSFAWD